MRKFIVIYTPPSPPVPQVFHCDSDDADGARRAFENSGLEGGIVSISETADASTAQHGLKAGDWVVWRDPDDGLSTQPAVVIDARHADFASLRGAGGSEIEAPYHEIDMPLTPINLDGLAYRPVRENMSSQSNGKEYMSDPTLPQFLNQAFAVIGRDPSEVVLASEIEDDVLCMDVEYIPEERYLEVDGGIARCELADYFLDRALDRKWEFGLGDRSNTGGLRTAMGFLSERGALVVILTDDEDREFQRVSLEFCPASVDEGADSWLERQKIALVSDEVRAASVHLNRLAGVVGRGRVDQMLSEFASSSV